WDWKKAAQAAGYFQKANELYSYLMPIFSPVTGLVRLGTQQWMVKPAWRNMQQNLLRWFFRAYVNRLGTHLIELYSGRLVIGVDQYRRLTRRTSHVAGPIDQELAHLVVAVAGARDSGKTALIAAVDQVRQDDPKLIQARLGAAASSGTNAGVDVSSWERFKDAKLVEIPSYTTGVEADG